MLYFCLTAAGWAPPLCTVGLIWKKKFWTYLRFCRYLEILKVPKILDIPRILDITKILEIPTFF